MDDLDKKIEEARERLKKTQQLAELNTLQEQAASINAPKAKPGTEPMERMLKYAFPAGVVLAGVGVASIMVFNNFAVGLAFGAFGAMAIGFKIAFTPGMKIPLLDDRGKKGETPKSSWIELK